MSLDQEHATGDADAEDEAAALARELGEAISDLPVYQRFAEAKERVEADEELQETISEFQQQRQEFMLARQTGEATEADMAELREAREEIDGHPKMAEFHDARDELTERLGDLNDAVSEPLVVDFGGEAGGCCED